MNNKTSTPRDIFADISKDLTVNSYTKGLVPVTEDKLISETVSGYEVREKLIKEHIANGEALADSMELPKTGVGSDSMDSGSKEDKVFEAWRKMEHTHRPVAYKAALDENGAFMGIATARGHLAVRLGKFTIDAADRVSTGAKEIADLTGLSIEAAEGILQSKPTTIEDKAPNPDSGTSFSI